MPVSTYWGHSVAVVRSSQTKTGVAIGQEEDGHKDLGAMCGKCYYLLHHKVALMEGTNDWICSNPGCAKTYPDIPDGAESSVFNGYRMDTPSEDAAVRNWVHYWTGIAKEDMIVTFDFER